MFASPPWTEIALTKRSSGRGRESPGPDSSKVVEDVASRNPRLCVHDVALIATIPIRTFWSGHTTRVLRWRLYESRHLSSCQAPDQGEHLGAARARAARATARRARRRTVSERRRTWRAGCRARCSAKLGRPRFALLASVLQGFDLRTQGRPHVPKPGHRQSAAVRQEPIGVLTGENSPHPLTLLEGPNSP